MKCFINRKAIWRNQDHDEPVTVIGELGSIESVRYFAILESVSGIPEDQLEFVIESEEKV